MLRKIYNKIVNSIEIDTDFTIPLNSEKRVRVFIYTEEIKHGRRYTITPNQSYIDSKYKERDIPKPAPEVKEEVKEEEQTKESRI